MDVLHEIALAEGLGSGLLAFLALWATVVVGVVGVFAATGLVLDRHNAAHPERRIQARVHPRKWRELRVAPQSILTLSFWFALGLFCQARGWTPTPLPITWWSIPLTLGIGIVLYDAWFYWGHRFMHLKRIWPIHALHHKSLVPTAWSNNHDSILDSTVCQIYFALLPFVLPTPWPALVLHKLYDQVSGMIGHCGFEHFASPMARAPFPLASTVFHDQHHSKFNYNFGHTFTFWDRVMGTIHPDYDATLARFEEPAET